MSNQMNKKWVQSMLLENLTKHSKITNITEMGAARPFLLQAPCPGHPACPGASDGGAHLLLVLSCLASKSSCCSVR